MGFPSDVRTKVLIRSARICCLCFKQCGTKIEVHHIVQEADGGPNTEANALPVCFDCHAEVGNYNPRHPKGTKFRVDELKARRDNLYKLVESGALLAQVLVKQLPADTAEKSAEAVNSDIKALPSHAEPDEESREFLKRILKPTTALDALGSKLKILGQDNAAWALDSLVNRTKESVRPIAVLARLMPSLSNDQKLLAIERTLRNVTLFGETGGKTAVLTEFGGEVLQVSDEALRFAFFRDVFEIVEHDQFDEVNELVPALVGAQECLPEALWADYVKLLINQSGSQSFKGAPAAKRALTKLSNGMVIAGLLALTPEVVCRFGHSQFESAQRLAAQYGDHVDGAQGTVIRDLATKSWRAFSDKYEPD